MTFTCARCNRPLTLDRLWIDDVLLCGDCVAVVINRRELEEKFREGRK
jgi:hypothetical protein